MASEREDQSVLRLVLASIPKFDGRNITIDEFLEACDEAFHIIGASTDPAFVKLISTKLRGEAREFARLHKFKSYRECRKLLYQAFAGHESVFQIFGKLGKMFQQECERVISFAIKIKKIKSQIINITELGGTLGYSNESIEELVVDAFLNGLLPELEIKFKARPNNLEEAIGSAIRFERGYGLLLATNETQESSREAEKSNNSEIGVNFAEKQSVPSAPFRKETTAYLLYFAPRELKSIKSFTMEKDISMLILFAMIASNLFKCSQIGSAINGGNAQLNPVLNITPGGGRIAQRQDRCSLMVPGGLAQLARPLEAQ
ncbi:hypothetical protein QAD02_016569 [Eretmocerus hayati]|uniref:Uncharacterized protein n=1 Tax=Eretmocerus hayati TaxID=131215 RepID=A0ACC2PBU5_9HYME|nr:hypothetical protein QAD02_016569 [Eretmocerus hayati]